MLRPIAGLYKFSAALMPTANNFSRKVKAICLHNVLHSKHLNPPSLGNRHFHTSPSPLKSAVKGGGDVGDIIDETSKTKERGQLQHFGAVDISPSQLRSKSGSFLRRGYRFAKSSMNDLTQEQMEGTIGASSLLSMDTIEVDKHLPTAMTLMQRFDGILYYQLPVVHIKATPNNTIISAADVVAKTVILYTSARKEGFKNARKRTALAGQTTGAAAGQKLLRRGITTVRVVVKGIGQGRMASVKGLASAGVNIVSISDFTPLPEIGPRPRKIRRV